MRLDFGADDAEDPATDYPGMIPVEPRQPQPREPRLAALALAGHRVYLRAPVVPLVVVNSTGGCLVNWAGFPCIAAVM
jgi:hypothetical protein